MKDFGQFSMSPEWVADGDHERLVYFVRNDQGEDICDVLNAFPHPYYIAVSLEGKIVSMEQNPEAIQIPNHTIIGIDDTQGFTRGEGGTVYGKLWSGSEIYEVADVNDPNFGGPPL